MCTKRFILVYILLVLSSKIGDVEAKARGTRKKSPLRAFRFLPEVKTSWCKAMDMDHSVDEKGCETKVIQNKACVGQCFSYYSPGTFPVRYASRNRKRYCDVCKPSVKRWTKVSLDCPGKNNSQVDKLVEMIYRCSCKRCGRYIQRQK